MCVILKDSWCALHVSFVCMVKFKFLAQIPVDHLAHSVVCRFIFFCANLLYSLIRWLTGSSLSPHNLHSPFYCVLSIVTLIWLFFRAFYCKVWSPSRDYVIGLYLKIQKNSVDLILQDGIWIVHMPYVRRFKFQYLSQFPVDHLAYRVVSCHILPLC